MFAGNASLVRGDTHSALIEFEDTPALLGSEFRFLSSVTFNNRAQIVRWIDYWDGRRSAAAPDFWTAR